MPITSVNEIHSSRKGGQDKTWWRKYTRVFKVETDNPYTGPATILQDSRIPKLGDLYRVPQIATEFDIGAFVEKRDIADAGEIDGKSWLVTVEYGPYNATNWPQNPLDHPVKINWSWAQHEKPADEDINGKAILNSAGDYFDPPVMRDDSRPVMQIMRNEASYDPRTAAQFKDSTNSSPWFGYDVGQVKCSNITASLEFAPDFGFYYAKTYEFQVIPNDDQNEDGWKRKILDQGLRQLNGTAREPISIKGTAATSPVPLDGQGKMLAVNADPVYLEFDIYKQQDFNALGFAFANAPGQTS